MTAALQLAQIRVQLSDGIGFPQPSLWMGFNLFPSYNDSNFYLPLKMRHFLAAMMMMQQCMFEPSTDRQVGRAS